MLVRVANPIESVRETIAEPGWEQEREIVNDAPTFPIANCCVSERMKIAHGVRTGVMFNTGHRENKVEPEN